MAFPIYLDKIFFLYKIEILNATVLCISLETLIVTYQEKYNFQHGLADV